MEVKNHRHLKGGMMLRHLVFGAEDGMISTIGFLTGVTGAAFTQQAILLATIVEVLAAALSMGVGTYLSTKSENEYLQAKIAQEKEGILNAPEQGKEELMELLVRKGYHGSSLQKAMKNIVKNKKKWLDLLVAEETGIIPKKFESPLKAAGAMFLAFVLVAIFPVFPFLFMQPQNAIIVSLLLTICALFAVGSGRTIYTGKKWWKSGIEMTSLGMGVAIIGYAAGFLIRQIGIL